jgi:hypothetical protein
MTELHFAAFADFAVLAVLAEQQSLLEASSAYQRLSIGAR